MYAVRSSQALSVTIIISFSLLMIFQEKHGHLYLPRKLSLNYYGSPNPSPNKLDFFVLVLTLSVSTASTERAFSTMKLLKTPLHNKMEDDFLTGCMVIYIEREIADTIDLEYIIDEFNCIKSRKTKFK
ncbi:hypothetical protein ACOSQ3_016232 [Xanthoceras sorbifolium]